MNSILKRIGNAFLACFGGCYSLALVSIVVLYYMLPATDAAKTSWFPIILFDPFVLTVAFAVASFCGLIVFLIVLSFIVLLTVAEKVDQHQGPPFS